LKNSGGGGRKFKKTIKLGGETHQILGKLAAKFNSNTKPYLNSNPSNWRRKTQSKTTKHNTKYSYQRRRRITNPTHKTQAKNPNSPAQPQPTNGDLGVVL
jgi:hypothetical protein